MGKRLRKGKKIMRRWPLWWYWDVNPHIAKKLEANKSLHIGKQQNIPSGSKNRGVIHVTWCISHFFKTQDCESALLYKSSVQSNCVDAYVK